MLGRLGLKTIPNQVQVEGLRAPYLRFGLALSNDCGSLGGHGGRLSVSLSCGGRRARGDCEEGMGLYGVTDQGTERGIYPVKIPYTGILSPSPSESLRVRVWGTVPWSQEYLPDSRRRLWPRAPNTCVGGILGSSCAACSLRKPLKTCQLRLGRLGWSLWIIARWVSFYVKDTWG
jgi:hypothetical protein